MFDKEFNLMYMAIEGYVKYRECNGMHDIFLAGIFRQKQRPYETRHFERSQEQ